MSKAREVRHSLYRLADRLLPQVYAAYSRSPLYRRKWRRRLASAALDPGHPPWRALAKPLADSTVALVTTGGVHLSSQAPHAAVGDDPTLRAIPGHTPISELRVFHPAVNNADANADPNIVFPLERLRELAGGGVIGRVAPTHYSFVGLLNNFRPLLRDTAPQMVAGLMADGVDFAILTPS
ncbi:MAG: glycine/sarcosine/betaine reductase selenoprotein B family protein [Anaerolineales bacterium]